MTKNESVLVAIWSCIAISAGMDMHGYVADVLLTLGGAGIGAAFMLPTQKEKDD